MRVVLLPAVAGRKTGQFMTNSRKRHTPEQVVRKLGQADRMLADGQDVAAVCRELADTVLRLPQTLSQRPLSGCLTCRRTCRIPCLTCRRGCLMRRLRWGGVGG